MKPAPQNPHTITLVETTASLGCIAIAMGMLKVAAMTVRSAPSASAGLLPGILVLGGSFLIGAVLGNAVAIAIAGREHAIDGVVLGGVGLTIPLTLACLQFL